jgi:hypothetical protein
VYGFTRLKQLESMNVFDDASADHPMAPYFSASAVGGLFFWDSAAVRPQRRLPWTAPFVARSLFLPCYCIG